MKKHILEFDGLRGLAILLVMVFHSVSFEPWNIPDAIVVGLAEFGWAGVDLFFVLSGMLITGILYDTRGSSSYFQVFFARRTLRIFPLYFAYLGGIAVFAYMVSPRLADAEAWKGIQAWNWLYLTNVYLAQQTTFSGGYLYTGHLWSLAIEEQFYLLWPFVVWRIRRERLMAICATVFVGALVFRTGMLWTGAASHVLYVLTPARIDALAAGAFIALLLRGPATEEALGRVGKLAIVGGVCLTVVASAIHASMEFKTPAMQTIGYTGIAFACAGLLLMVRITKAPFVPRLLRSGFLTALGRYSYGLYVLHPIVFGAVTAHWLPMPSAKAPMGVMLASVLARAAVCCVVAFGAAFCSWHVLEKWFVGLKSHFSYREPIPTPAQPEGA